MACALNEAQIRAYEEDGLVIARGLFDAAEVELLRGAMERDPSVRDHMLDRLDGEGRATRISAAPATASTASPRAAIAWSTR